MTVSIGTRAASLIGRVSAAAFGVTVKYRRNNLDCELTAVPGLRASEDYGSDGATFTATVHDWIVDPTKLRIDGLDFHERTNPPKADDLIVTADGQTFVVTFEGTENCWRWTDQFRQRIRIHTVARSATGEDE